MDKTIVVANLMFHPYEKMFEQSRRVHGAKGVSLVVHTAGGGHQEIKIVRVFRIA